MLFPVNVCMFKILFNTVIQHFDLNFHRNWLFTAELHNEQVEYVMWLHHSFSSY